MNERGTQTEIDETASMDSDYGSSPRVGVDNLAATPVAADWPQALTDMLGLCGTHASNFVRAQPKTALLAAAVAGFAAAVWLRRRS
jgi:hypothetical protein